jgi:hypothetical protein
MSNEKIWRDGISWERLDLETKQWWIDENGNSAERKFAEANCFECRAVAHLEHEIINGRGEKEKHYRDLIVRAERHKGQYPGHMYDTTLLTMRRRLKFYETGNWD